MSQSEEAEFQKIIWDTITSIFAPTGQILATQLYEKLLINLKPFKQQLQAAQAELNSIDNALARRNALDFCKTRTEKVYLACRIAGENDPQGSIVALREQLQAALQRIEEVWLERDEAKRVRDERIAELEQQNDDYTEQLAKNGERLMKLLEPTTAAGRESEGGE